VNIDDKGNLLVPADKTYPDGKIDGMVGKVLDESNKIVPGKEGEFTPASAATRSGVI